MTLLPTSAIPAMPGARSRKAVEAPVVVVVVFVVEVFCMRSSVAPQWSDEQVQ